MKLKQIKLHFSFVFHGSFYIQRKNSFYSEKMSFQPGLVGQFPGIPPAPRQTGHKRSPFWSRHWLSKSAIASDMLFSLPSCFCASFCDFNQSVKWHYVVWGSKMVSTYRWLHNIKVYILYMLYVHQFTFCTIILLKWKSRSSLRHTNLTVGGKGQSQEPGAGF